MASRVPVWIGLSLALSGVARADWEVKHAANDPRVVDALYGAFIRAPDDRGALARLTAHASKAERLRLAERCVKEGASLLACGHLYREGGDAESALKTYARLDDPRAHRAAGMLFDRLGRTEDALRELERAQSSATPAQLEELLSLYGRAQALPLDDRRKKAEALAIVLAKGADEARTKRIAEALATVGDNARAAQLYGELAAHGDPVTRVPLYFRQAELATAAEAYDDATAALERGVALLPPRDGRRREALEREVDIERKRDRLPQLAAKLSAIASKDAATEELLGRVLDETGDAAGAQKHLQKAIGLDPRAIGARRLLVRLYARAGDEDAAIAELRKLSAATGHEPRTEVELAERLHGRAGGDKEALAIAVALGQHHHDAGTHATLAALYQKWGDVTRAIAEAQLLVKLEPDDPEHLIALGELYDQKGDKAQARKEWARIAPGDKAALERRLRLADVLSEHDEGGEALSILERASHEHPDDVVVQRKLADVLDRLRRDVEAELIYRRLLDSAAARNDAAQVRDLGARWLELAVQRGSLPTALPKLTTRLGQAQGATRIELALLVARARVRERRLDEAERILRIASTEAPASDRGRLLEARAELVAASGREAEALELLVEAAKVDELRAPLLYGKASARAAALYRDEDALRFAEKAVTLAPTDPDAQERLGSLLEPRDPARALAAYDRALELDGTRDRLRLRTAELALRRGDDEGAARRYRELLGRARDEQALEEAARRAVVVHELTGRLGVLEREIAPRAGAADDQGTLRRLLIEIDRRYVPQLAARAEAGDEAAKVELEHVAQHALGPLLDGIVEGDRDERRAAIQLVGQLGSKGATPLLLRLAAGEAARRGAELPPIELRTAAAEAAIALVTDGDLPRLARLATDPEMRVRLAAVVALGRLGAHATHELERALSDEHDRVVAAACLVLPADAPLDRPTQLVQLALDPARSLAARACGVQLARRLAAHDDPTLAHALLASDWRGHVTLGLARALLETGDTTAAQEGLLALLADPAAHRASAQPVRATVDLVGALALAEANPPPVRDAAALRATYARLLTGPSASTALADLLVEEPLMPRLLGDRDARAALLDEVAPQLAKLAQARDAATRTLAIALASERRSSLQALLSALSRQTDRRAALDAMSSPHARALDASEATAVAPLVKAALSAADWRERRAALGCVRAQPQLAVRLKSDAARLRGDENALVSGLATD